MKIVRGYLKRAEKVRLAAATEPDFFTRRDMLLFAELLDLAARRRKLLIQSYPMRSALAAFHDLASGGLGRARVPQAGADAGPPRFP